MPYIIQTRFKADHGHAYDEWRAEHIAYLDENVDKVLAGGALLEDDGTGPHGGCIIVDTDDRQEAENLVANDPFSRAGLFESVTVTRWRKAFFNFERLI